MNLLAGLKAVLALVALLNKVLTLAKSYEDREAGKAEAIILAVNHVDQMVSEATTIRAAAAKRDADPAKLRERNPHSRT